MAERFKELSNGYYNTGGHCMVDITAVYDNKQKQILYINVGNDWMSLTTRNVVMEELPDNLEAADFTLYDMAMSDYTTDPMPDNTSMNNMPEEYFCLFDCGLQSYIRNTFKHYEQPYQIAVESLPTSLRRQISDEYAMWLDDEGLLAVTDGVHIIVHDQFKYSDYDCNGRAAVDLKQHLMKMRADADIDDDYLATFENEEIHVIVGGKVFTLQMCAAVWNGLIGYAEHIIDEQ